MPTLKSPTVPTQDWTQRDVLDHQFTHGVRPAPRSVCAGDCAPRTCLHSALLERIAEVVTDYLSKPMCQDETAMPLETLRLWLRWRFQHEELGNRICARLTFTNEVLEMVTWVLNQQNSGLAVVPVKKRRTVAA